MSDPYRGTIMIRCARCSASMQRDPKWMQCPRGHGYFHVTTQVNGHSLDELGELAYSQTNVGRCPECRKWLQLRRWDGVTIEVCAKHGVWIFPDDFPPYSQRAGD